MSSGLWSDHPATPRQEHLVFKSSRRRTRPTQADVLLAMLREAKALGRPVELPEILRSGIAQHGARLGELRERGFEIENEMERTPERVLSRYWLRRDPEMERSE